MDGWIDPYGRSENRPRFLTHPHPTGKLRSGPAETWKYCFGWLISCGDVEIMFPCLFNVQHYYVYIYIYYIYNIIPVVIEWRSVAFARPWSVTRLDPLFPVLWAGLLNLKLGQGVNLMERKHWNVLQSHFMLLLFLQKTSPVGRVKHYWYNSLYFPKGPSRTLEPHENDENGSIKVPWDRGVPAPLAPSTPQVESSAWPWHSRPVPRRCHGRNVMVRFAGSRPTNLEMIS